MNDKTEINEEEKFIVPMQDDSYANIIYNSPLGGKLYMESGAEKLNEIYGQNTNWWQDFSDSFKYIEEIENPKEQQMFYEGLYARWYEHVLEEQERLSSEPDLYKRFQEQNLSGDMFYGVNEKQMASAKGWNFITTALRGRNLNNIIENAQDPSSMTVKDFRQFVEKGVDPTLFFLHQGLRIQKADKDSQGMSWRKITSGAVGFGAEVATEVYVGKRVPVVTLGKLAKVKKLSVLKKLENQVNRVNKLKPGRFGNPAEIMGQTFKGSLILKGGAAVVYETTEDEARFTFEEAAVLTVLESLGSGAMTSGLNVASRKVASNLEKTAALRKLRKGEQLSSREFQQFKMLHEIMVANIDDITYMFPKQFKAVSKFIEETKPLYETIHAAKKSVRTLNKMIDTGSKETIKKYVNDHSELLRIADDLLEKQSLETPGFGIGRVFEKLSKEERAIRSTYGNDIIKEAEEAFDRGFVRWVRKNNKNLVGTKWEFAKSNLKLLNRLSYPAWRNSVLSNIPARLLEFKAGLLTFELRNIARVVGFAAQGDFETAKVFLSHQKARSGLVDLFSTMGVKRSDIVKNAKTKGAIVSFVDYLSDLRVIKRGAFDPDKTLGKDPAAYDLVLNRGQQVRFEDKINDLANALVGKELSSDTIAKIWNNLSELTQLSSRTLPMITDVFLENGALLDATYYYTKVLGEEIRLLIKGDLDFSLGKGDQLKLTQLLGKLMHMRLTGALDVKALKKLDDPILKEIDELLGDDTFIDELFGRDEKIGLFQRVYSQAEESIARLGFKQNLISPNRSKLITKTIGAADGFLSRQNRLGVALLVQGFLRSGTNIALEGMYYLLPKQAIQTVIKSKNKALRAQAFGELFVSAGLVGGAAVMYRQKMMSFDKERKELQIQYGDNKIALKRTDPTLHQMLASYYIAFDTIEEISSLMEVAPPDIKDELSEMTLSVGEIIQNVTSNFVLSNYKTLMSARYRVEGGSPGEDIALLLANFTITPYDAFLDLIEQMRGISDEGIRQDFPLYLDFTDGITSRLYTLRTILESQDLLEPLQGRYDVKGNKMTQKFSPLGLVYYQDSEEEPFEKIARENGLVLQPLLKKEFPLKYFDAYSIKAPRDFHAKVAEYIRGDTFPVNGGMTYTKAMNLYAEALSKNYSNRILIREKLKARHTSFYQAAIQYVAIKEGLIQRQGRSNAQILRNSLKENGVRDD